MTATPQKIKDRVRKLLSLAQSENMNEASVAAANAQKLIDQHNIDLAMLDEEDASQLFEEDPVNDPNKFECFSTKSHVVAWKWALLWDICTVNDCKPWSKTVYDEEKGYQRKFYAIGRPSDGQQVVDLFKFVVAQIEHLAKTADYKESPWETKRSFRNSFRHGAGSTVGNRLKREWQQRRRALTDAAEAEDKKARALEEGDAKDTALMLAETSLVRAKTAIERLEKRPKKVEQFMEYEGLKYASGSARSFTGSGFGAGLRAGKTVRTSTGQKALS